GISRLKVARFIAAASVCDSIGTAISDTTDSMPNFASSIRRYLGMTTRTSCPSRLSALGSAPVTSARPPTLANGTTSVAAIRIFMSPELGRERHLGGLRRQRRIHRLQLARHAGPAV